MEAVTAILSNSWNFLSSVTVPGFGFTFAQVLIGAMFCTILFKVGQIVFGIFGGAVGGVGRSAYRAGRANKVKVSDNRKGDTH